MNPLGTPDFSKSPQWRIESRDDNIPASQALDEADQKTTPPSEQDGHWKQAKSQRRRKSTSKQKGSYSLPHSGFSNGHLGHCKELKASAPFNSRSTKSTSQQGTSPRIKQQQQDSKSNTAASSKRTVHHQLLFQQQGGAKIQSNSSKLSHNCI
ncbi:hypothetical protein Nepgr_002671 [Nepenthes gracilis]|uniref:Uncharacterized protein n=1 Tax=Nepenthes gracilis TaxID=150966 RepID=A0AAD3PA82_NEPGR|nr:hypothetical protein Nepgr_002671 [Nepenthes gracilis]